MDTFAQSLLQRPDKNKKPKLTIASVPDVSPEKPFEMPIVTGATEGSLVRDEQVLTTAQSPDASQESTEPVVPPVTSTATPSEADVPSEPTDTKDIKEVNPFLPPTMEEVFAAEDADTSELSDDEAYQQMLDTASEIKDVYDERIEASFKERTSKLMESLGNALEDENVQEANSMYSDIGAQLEIALKGTVELPRYLLAYADTANLYLQAGISSMMDSDLSFDEAKEKLKNTDHNIARMIVGSELIDETITNPVFQGTTWDGKAHAELLADIQEETGTQPSTDYMLGTQVTSAAVQAALFNPVKGAAKFFTAFAKNPTKLASTLKGVKPKNLKDSKELLASVAAKIKQGKITNPANISQALIDNAKMGGLGASSVYAAHKAIEVFEPDSPEGQLLVGMTAGMVAPGATGAVSKYGAYMPSVVAAKVAVKAAKAGKQAFTAVNEVRKAYQESKATGRDFKDVLKERAMNNEKTVEFVETLKKSIGDPETAKIKAEELLTTAEQNPLSTEALAVKVLSQMFDEDSIAFKEAKDFKERIAVTLENADITLLDTYQGKFRDQLLAMYDLVDTSGRAQHWLDVQDSIHKLLNDKSKLSVEEVQSLKVAAMETVRNIEAQIDGLNVDIKQTLIKEVETIQNRLLELTDDTHLATVDSMKRDVIMNNSLQKLKDSLLHIRKVGKEAMSALYAAVDPQNKITVPEAPKVFTSFLKESVRQGTKLYPKVSKAYYSTMFDYLGRILDLPDNKLPNIIKTGSSKVSPMSMFSDVALANTKGDTVYMSIPKIKSLLKIKEGTEGVQATPTSKHKATPFVTLDIDKKGIVYVKHSGGANIILGLEQQFSNSSSPIPLDIRLTKKLSKEYLLDANEIPIRLPDGKVVKLPLKKQMEQANKRLRQKRAEIEIAREIIRTSKQLAPEEIATQPELFITDNIKWNYKEANKLHKDVRKAKDEAYRAQEFEEHNLLKDLDTVMKDVIEGSLSEHPDAVLRYQKANSIYRDKYIPDFLDPTNGIIGKVANFKKNGQNSKLMSEIVKEVFDATELRLKIKELTKAETFSLFKDIFQDPESLALASHLDDLFKNKESLFKDFKESGRNVADAVGQIIIQDLIKTFDKRMLKSKEDPLTVFQEVASKYAQNETALAFFETSGKLKDIGIALKQLADNPLAVSEKLSEIVAKERSLNDIFYDNIRKLEKKEAATTILHILKDPYQSTLAAAQMELPGSRLGAAKDVFIKTFLQEAIRFDAEGKLQVEHLNKAIERYGQGIEVLDKTGETLRLVNDLKELGVRLGNKPTPMEIMEIKRFSGLLGIALDEAPSLVSTWTQAIKWNLSRGYITALRGARLGLKQMKTLETSFQRISAEIMIGALTDPEFLSRFHKIAKNHTEAVQSSVTQMETVQAQMSLLGLSASNRGLFGLLSAIQTAKEIAGLNMNDEEDMNRLEELSLDTKDDNFTKEELKLKEEISAMFGLLNNTVGEE